MKTDVIDQSLLDESQYLVKELDRAWNERDPEGLAALFHEGADFQFYYGLMVRGRARIERFYREKVFPYLAEGMRHVTRSFKLRQIAEGVVIGDGRVDLVDIQEPDPALAVQRRVKVTAVVVKGEGGWRFSAVRIMVPVKD
jgi:uncharacterized protein (TIGR02246 family)